MTPAPEQPRGEAIVEATGIRKHYSGVQALNGVDLTIHAGEAIGLLGANGAGKSTLIKVISGMVAPDDGTVRVDGKVLPGGAVRAAQQAGISIVPQELNLVPEASVAENMLLWHLPTRSGLVSRRRMANRAREVLEGLEVSLDVTAPVGHLTAVEQRLVMVAAAVSQDARVLILDEPTAALPPEEARHVLDVAARVRDLGKAVVFVSHRLNEVCELVDRAVIMREGEVVGELTGERLTIERIVEGLGGSNLGATGFRISDDDEVHDDSGPPRMIGRKLSGVRVQEVDVSFRSGEILGIAGLVGAGRSELLRLMAGVQPHTGGEIEFDGRPVEKIPRRRRRIGYIGEDRSKNLFREFDVTGNVSLPSLGRFARGGVIRRRREVSAVGDIVGSVGIKGRADSNVWGLSGGNRQKVLLGRWLMSGAEVLLLDEPTAGLDPLARAEVHDLLHGVAANGGSVVVAISDPAELLSLCDRVVVIREGRLVHVERRPFDEGRILSASYAHHPQEI
jgi:ribose transport system ATP-binding protein